LIVSPTVKGADTVGGENTGAYGSASTRASSSRRCYFFRS